MLGYLDDPEATKAAIDADGWLHTGDVGRLDAAGYLTITDRLKDMYICGGFNVYPAEVEQVLARLDGVAESAVIGVPDPRLGEVGRAYVVRRPGQVLDAADGAGLLPGAARQLQGAPAGGVPRRAAAQPVGQGAQATAKRVSPDGGRGPATTSAAAVAADHPEPAAVPQRAELGDDLRAGRRLRPGGERRPGRGDRAGRRGRPLLRRARHRHPGAGRGQVLRPRRRCCGGTTSARPAPTPGTPARWRSTWACAGAGGRCPSPPSRWCRAPASPAA